MRRSSLALVLSTLIASLASAQTPVAVPPEKGILDRLHLTTDWMSHFPIESRQDSVSHFQIVDQAQIFVQTKSGMLMAFDANTGRMLWKYRYPAKYASGFPVGYNDRFVFAINVSKLYCFDRFRGSMEFEYDMPSAPVSGPVADDRQIYIAQSGSVIQSYLMPAELRIRRVGNEITLGEGLQFTGTNASQRQQNIADAIAARNQSSLFQVKPRDTIDKTIVPQSYTDRTGGIGRNQVSPSIQMLTSVVPPYIIGNLQSTPSIQMLNSVKQPYTGTPEHMKYSQQTPSIQMTKTVTTLGEQSNLRPSTLKPEASWAFGMREKTQREPLLVKATADSPSLLWLNQMSGNYAATSIYGQVIRESRFDIPAVSSISGPYLFNKMLIGFVTLNDGRVLAIDLQHFTEFSAKLEWTARVGGFLNHSTIADATSVYASGERSGISRIDFKTGEVIWRSEENVDRVLAVNESYIYARDREGVMHIYQKDKISDATTMLAKPMASMSIEGFNYPVTNNVSDRIYLVSNSGLIVTLRQNSPKYNRIVRIAPENTIPVEQKPADKPADQADPGKTDSPAPTPPATPGTPAMPAKPNS